MLTTNVLIIIRNCLELDKVLLKQQVIPASFNKKSTIKWYFNNIKVKKFSFIVSIILQKCHTNKLIPNFELS